MRLSDLQNKDIVNVVDGRNVGNIIDVKIDEDTGNIVSFIIEPSKTFFSFFNRGNLSRLTAGNVKNLEFDFRFAIL